MTFKQYEDKVGEILGNEKITIKDAFESVCVLLLQLKIEIDLITDLKGIESNEQ